MFLKNLIKFSRIVLLATYLVGVSACSVKNKPAVVKVIQQKKVYVQENAVPGTIEEAWVEPLYDTVEVPAQLDPTGTYYRLPHKNIYEIRPGRYQEVQYPDSDR